MSDTRISHPDPLLVEEIPGRLKLVTIRADLCIGFAGPADYGIDEVRAVAKSSVDTLEEVATLLLRTTVESDGKIDFIVAKSHPAARVLKIHGGKIEEVPGFGWIGDGGAGEEFDRRFAGHLKSGSGDDSSRILSLTQSFSEVVRQGIVPTVAGLEISVISTDLGFQYCTGAWSFYPSQTIPSGVATPLRFGGRAEGGVAYSVLVPRSPGTPVVAVHFYQGKLGFIYAPLTQDKPATVPNVSHDELREVVRGRFGVEVNGLKIG